MPRIDKFIGAAVQAGASKILIATGQKACMFDSGGVRTMTAQQATARQVMDIFNEIAPPEAAGSGRFSFVYESPSGAVGIRFAQDGDTVRLEVLTDPGAAEAAPPQAAAEAGPVPVIPIAAAHEETVIETAEGTVVPPEDSLESLVAGTLPLPATRAGQATGASPAIRPEAASEVPATPAAARRMEDLLRRMVEQGCSDLHLSSGNPPLFRKDGSIVALGSAPPIQPSEMADIILSIAPRKSREQFDAARDSDFAYEIPGLARFRCNVFMDRIGIGGVFRVIPSAIPAAEELGLTPAVLELCGLSKGLVLVTGPTGSGKSTTLAAMIAHINRTRAEHIITIEDPIEFVHQNLRCLVNQREVGVHTSSFKSALRAALREDPDIILVGELRDLETIAIAIETAETGHLVFGTLHTNTAPSTVDRIIDQFPPDRQSQVRTMLSESLKGVISQTLCRKKGGGRVAAHEILLVNAAISNLIREGKTFQIPSLMQTGKGAGMRTMNDALSELVARRLVDPEEALAKAINKTELKGMLGRGAAATAGAAAP